MNAFIFPGTVADDCTCTVAFWNGSCVVGQTLWRRLGPMIAPGTLKTQDWKKREETGASRESQWL